MAGKTNPCIILMIESLKLAATLYRKTMKTAGSILLLLWLLQTIFIATKIFSLGPWLMWDSLYQPYIFGGKSQLINVSKNATRFVFTVKFRHTEWWTLLMCHKRKQCFQETLLTNLIIVWLTVGIVGILLLGF